MFSINRGPIIDDFGCSFPILSNDHNFGAIGQYFNFDVATADCTLGTPFLHNTVYNVFYSGDNSFRSVVIWRNPNQGSVGDGHGRKNSGAAGGDWLVNQQVAFVGPQGCDYTNRESISSSNIANNSTNKVKIYTTK